MVLMDKLQVMVKLKEKIYELRKKQVDKEELRKLEELLLKMQTGTDTKSV